jgi:hypothetical protein
MAVPQAASAQYCYRLLDGGGISFAPGDQRCAGVGLGLQSPRWYYSDNYPYYIYPENLYPASNDFARGCHLVRRPVLTPSGWRKRTVQLCD